MRSWFCGALLLALILGGGTTPAWAGRVLRVTLPFEFGAGGETFPKGSCKIEIVSATKVSIQCSNVRAMVPARTLTFRGDAFKAIQVKEMTFKRYGDRYFLCEVWLATDGRELLPSDAEKALVEEGVEATPVKLKVK
jgi:hypothetical protein